MKNHSRRTKTTKSFSQNIIYLTTLIFYLLLSNIIPTTQPRYLPKSHKNYRLSIENLKDNIKLCNKLGGEIRCTQTSCRCTRTLFNFSIKELNNSIAKRKNKTTISDNNNFDKNKMGEEETDILKVLTPFRRHHHRKRTKY